MTVSDQPMSDQKLVTDPKQWRTAVESVVRLVRAGDITSAQTQMDVMTRWTPDAPRDEVIAEALQTAASSAGRDGDATAFEWLWKKALKYWYFWGSSATSGGEGAARGLRISAADEAYKREKRELGLS